ncbi:BA14K family protein [Bradyrhizobium sp.]|uniref:BA14K family protein n=1 Tax=Bradyrhizobium sp. TaxID=376 RepID=UPI003C6F968D
MVVSPDNSAHPTLEGTTVSTSLRNLAVSALLASGLLFTGAASAAPLGELLAIAKANPNVTQTVQWRGGGWGWGAPVVGGLIAGAIVGGAIANAPYGPGYYGPPPVAYGPPPGDAVAYCMQQYRSYDPRSGTYLGYDGFRHPCP